MTSQPPLSSIRVLEFAGLAPGPFAGKLLADYGAQVLRIDRHTSSPALPTSDRLASHKRSLRVNLKSAGGISLIKALAQSADVLIDPFRPGVLEKLGLGPGELCAANPRLVYARMAGFRRVGKYATMAGHDINYIAVSGVLSLLGRKGEKPYAPGNLIGDFVGGGMVCFVGILLALLQRGVDGKGQVIEANMVDGSAYMAAFPRAALLAGTGMFEEERGTGLLDGGAPFYDTYETKDGKYMAVGALEPQFYAELLKRLLPDMRIHEIPDRAYRENWPVLRDMFTLTFLGKTRKEWEDIFDGSDACVTPVKTYPELKAEGYKLAPPVTLKGSPAKEEVDAWNGVWLKPGEGGKEALEEWWGLKEGSEWMEGEEGAVLMQAGKASSKL
ncbi:CoA-transferase family III domain-containing protein [Sphaerosporella brunnea]|uniref:CoA-transferase family III domain-containing protein n=1 Tax=Sphaerosporella brunnea TaxID=1250544 RepID=A0A5J5F6S7_9PEZI|nr:CoA-transferase family III domain-containing protein [Sphaerosporella brunnea]